jgi:drug/metabolite transporter (DMT)-like permease
MAFSDLFITVALVVLVILAMIFVYFLNNRLKKRPSRIAIIAMFLVIAGILFGEDPYLGLSSV